MWRFKLTDELNGFISKLHPEIKAKIKLGLKAIPAEPDIGKTLKEELKGLKSLRVGKFRIIYRLEKQKTITIIAIGPRRTIYEETMNLLQKE